MAAWWTTPTVFGALLSMSVGLEASGPIQAGTPDAPYARCRPMGDAAALLLQEAARRSPSVTALLRTIEGSDVIVFVVISNEPGDWRGGTRLASERGKPRMLRVTVQGSLAPVDRIAVLAHELQHVTEVAGAPDVVDLESMRRFFKKIGHELDPAGRHYETSAAQDIEYRVRQELRSR